MNWIECNYFLLTVHSRKRMFVGCLSDYFISCLVIWFLLLPSPTQNVFFQFCSSTGQVIALFWYHFKSVVNVHHHCLWGQGGGHRGGQNSSIIFQNWLFCQIKAKTFFFNLGFSRIDNCLILISLKTQIWKFPSPLAVGAIGWPYQGQNNTKILQK